MTRGRDWDESEHPRWPDGAPGGKGGEFRDAGGGGWAERLSGMLPGAPATPKRTELEREREKLDNLQARLRVAREKRKRGVGKGAKPSGTRGAAESKLEAQILEQRKVVTRLQIATDMQRVNPPKADEPDIPKLTPAAAKFLATYITNSRLNAGERVPIQLTKNGLVRVRTGKNGIGLTERWLELTPEGRRVQQALRDAPAKTASRRALARSVNPPELGGEGPYGPIAWQVMMDRFEGSTERIARDPTDLRPGQAVYSRGGGGWATIVRKRPVTRREPDDYDILFGPRGRYTNSYSGRQLREWVGQFAEMERYAKLRETKKKTAPAKKTAAPKLRKSLRPGDQVEWTDEQDGVTLRGTVRRQGRFTMVDWEGGRSEKVSARGTDPSIRKVADAPKDYVQPEETPPVKIAKKAAPKKAPATVRPKVRPVTEWTDEEIAEQLLKKRPGTAVYAKILAEFNRREGRTVPADGWLTRVDGQLAGKAPAAEAAAHRVVGRDLIGELDPPTVSLLMEIAPKTTSHNGDPDPALAALVARQGYDGSPEVVSSEEMDRRVAAGWAQTWRGISSWLKDDGERVPGGVMAEQYRSGDYWPGMGVFGSGTYTSVERDTVLGYLDGLMLDNHPGLLRIAISPDARVVDYDDLVARYERERWERHPEGYQGTPYEYLWADMGRYATGLGYDAIAAQPRNEDYRDGRVMYYVILNRTAVAVQEAPRG